MTGTIHNLHERGFGFIAPDDDSSREARHFFHANHLVGANFESLKPGLRVEFNSIRGDRGLEARNVHVIESHAHH